MFFFFFFNDTATTEIYTLSLHDALPISVVGSDHRSRGASTCNRNRPMRVLHVIAPVSFGGGESLLVNLLRERRPDLDETVVSLYHAPEFEQRLQAIGIPTWLLRNTCIGAGVSRRRVLVETPMNLCLAPRLWRLVKGRPAGILHIFRDPRSAPVSLFLSLTNVRCV